MGAGARSQGISEMKKIIPPANFKLIEIKNSNQIPKGSSFVIFAEGMYNLNEVVRDMWGDKHCVVYYIVHTYKGRDTRNYFVLYPPKKENKK
jgi:hypothetical protein